MYVNVATHLEVYQRFLQTPRKIYYRVSKSIGNPLAICYGELEGIGSPR
jgi:hypothetical protein